MLCRFQPIVGELFSELRLHRGDIGVQTIKIDIAADLELRCELMSYFRSVVRRPIAEVMPG